MYFVCQCVVSVYRSALIRRQIRIFEARSEWRISSAGRGVSSVAIVRAFIAFLATRRNRFVRCPVGHIAENCASEQRLCYNCRQPGHESSACPQPRSVAAKQCYSCGGVGHIQAECPSLRVQASAQKCYVSSALFLCICADI